MRAVCNLPPLLHNHHRGVNLWQLPQLCFRRDGCKPSGEARIPDTPRWNVCVLLASFGHSGSWTHAVAAKGRCMLACRSSLPMASTGCLTGSCVEIRGHSTQPDTIPRTYDNTSQRRRTDASTGPGPSELPSEELADLTRGNATRLDRHHAAHSAQTSRRIPSAGHWEPQEHRPNLDQAEHKHKQT